MKLSNPFFFILLFIVVFTSSQTKNNDTDTTTSLIDSINIKIKKAYSLTNNYKYNKALTLTLQCIKQSDSIKNDSLLGKSYLTYGVINTYLGKEEQAILNYRKAEAIFIKIKNHTFLGSAYNNIGWTYSINNKSLDSIKIYYKKALIAYTKANDKRRIATALNNIGYKHIELNEFDKAESMLNKSLNLYKQYPKIKKINFYLSYTYSSLSELYLKKKNFQKALKYGDSAEKIAFKHGYEKTLKEVYRLKNKIFDTQGNYRKAYVYLKKYQEKLKVTHTNERSRITQEMSAKFEVKEHNTHLEKAIFEKKSKEDKLKKSKQLITIIASLFIFIFFVAFLLYNNNNLKLENNRLLTLKNNHLKSLQLRTELIFLKTQIQPHFFFNTLNNLYSLIIEKSNKAKDVILKLSELMKYTLHDSETITAPLKEEIKNIKNYIELESLRYEKMIPPNIEIIGKMKNIKVLPLLYITFIENCFKHNNVNHQNFKLLISFKNIESKYLLFKVQNTITSQIETKKKIGIGIENIKRRLKIVYMNDYDLNISIENNIFSVHLKIPIQTKSIHSMNLYQNN